MELTYDSQRDRRANLQTIVNPTWAEVEQAIRRLDAALHTEVVLIGAGHLSVGGGGGQYFVSIFTDDERSLVLVDSSKPEGETTYLVSAGQKVALRAREVTDIALALKAARTFHARGTADDALVWEEE